jgi:hypothetical protein
LIGWRGAVAGREAPSDDSIAPSDESEVRGSPSKEGGDGSGVPRDDKAGSGNKRFIGERHRKSVGLCRRDRDILTRATKKILIGL